MVDLVLVDVDKMILSGVNLLCIDGILNIMVVSWVVVKANKLSGVLEGKMGLHNKHISKRGLHCKIVCLLALIWLYSF